VEISQHIRDLLLTHDRVILPDFGAFIAKYKPAKINDETHTMSPPCKEIIFDSRIIVNGGLLENYIAQHENISTDEATVQIREYVKTLKSKLNAGKEVKLVELGSFSKGKEGIVMFSYEPSGNLLLDSYGLPKITLPKGVKTIKASEAPKQEPKKKSRTGLIVMIATAAVIVIIGFLLYFFRPQWVKSGKEYVAAFFQKDTTKTNNLNLAENLDLKNNETEKDSTVKEIIKKDVKENKTDTTANKSKQDKTEDNSITPPLNNKNKANNAPTYINPEKGKAYLIVGSLPNEKTAEDEKAKFAKKGIDVQIVPSGEKKFRLTLGVYAGGKEASAEYETFHAKYPEIQVWLWENF